MHENFGLQSGERNTTRCKDGSTEKQGGNRATPIEFKKVPTQDKCQKKSN